MKQTLTILSLFLTIAVSAQLKPADSLKLIAASKEFHQHLITANTASINQITDKALSYGHSNGWVESKAEMLNNLKTKYITYISYAEDSISVTSNGNIANLRYRASIEATLKGVAATYYLHVLEVWIKKGNRWVLFSRQSVKKV